MVYRGYFWVIGLQYFSDSFLNVVNWSLYSVYLKKNVGFCNHGTINTVMMVGCVLGKGHMERYRGTGERPLKLQETSGVGLSHLPWWHPFSFKHPFSLLLWLGIPTPKCVSLYSTSDPHEHLQ